MNNLKYTIELDAKEEDNLYILMIEFSLSL